MDNYKVKMDKYIRSKFTDEEWWLLMEYIHTPTCQCSKEVRQLKRAYWRLKKTQSRLIQKEMRMSDPGFRHWLQRRGLPMDKYRHKYWRDYNIDKGDNNDA